MKLINNFKRDNLIEGRTHGLGFAFAKKVGNNFKTVMPISSCKDYLNDVLYAQYKKEYLPLIYGFKYTGEFDIIGKNYAYLILEVCPERWGNHYYNNEQFSIDKNTFSKCYKHTQNKLNEFEDKLGIKFKSKIIKKNDMYLVKMPKFWTKRIYLLSLYTLILRSFFNYNGVPTDRATFAEDAVMFEQAKPKLEKIINGELPEQPLNTGDSHYIHNNCGIINFKL